MRSVEPGQVIALSKRDLVKRLSWAWSMGALCGLSTWAPVLYVFMEIEAMKSIKAAVAVLLVAMLAGCAGPAPIIDLKGVDQGKYEADLKECNQFREDVVKKAETNVVSAAGADWLQRNNVVKKCMTGRGYKVLN